MNEKDFNSFINYLYNKGLTNGDSGDSGYGHYYDMIKYLKELRKTHLNSIQSWWYNYTLTGK